MSGSFTVIEMHILDFDEDIYDLLLRFTFLRRLRDVCIPRLWKR